jgi:glycosyltransferase involved in cell wall biosynthesis
MEQSYPVHEVIVVDAFSGDGTARVASSLGAKVVLASGTQAAAKNVGLTVSGGDYVLFLDSDQEAEDGVVEDCVTTCVRNGADAVKIPELFVGVNFWGRCSAFWKNKTVKVWGSDGGIPRFYRRSVLQSSAYNISLRFWDDLELYQRLRRFGLRREAWCSAHVVHYEAASLREVVDKYVSYGRSIVQFSDASAKAPIKSTVMLTVSTALNMLRDPRKSPTTFLGCILQLVLKTVCAAIGFLTGLRRSTD